MNQTIKFTIEDITYLFTFYQKIIHFSAIGRGESCSLFIYYSEIIEVSLCKYPLRLLIIYIDRESEMKVKIEIKLPNDEIEKLSEIGKLLENIERKIGQGGIHDDKTLN